MAKLNFKYNIGDQHNQLTIISEPFKLDSVSKRYFVKVKCQCGKEFNRCTRKFENAKECKVCTAKKSVQKTISKQIIKEIPIGTKFGHLTVNGKCFKYKSDRRLPVSCDCGLKYEIHKKDWGKTRSCIKCRSQYRYDNQYNCDNETKKCSICQQIKILPLFGRDNKNKTNGRRADCKECQSIKQRASKFGLTIEEIQTLFYNQNHQCAICGTKLEHYSDWCIDHDHHTGKIRGILCSNCNGGLGFFYDDEQFLQNAIDYLRKNN